MDIMLRVVTARGKANTCMWWHVNRSASPVTKLRLRRNYTRTELAVKRWALGSPTRRGWETW